MSAGPKAMIRTLGREECDKLLLKHHVGRIAFSYRDRVDIEPINYVYADGWIYGRTSHGSKLRTLAHNRWLAFETDDVRGPLDWTSVVVKGSLYVLEKEGARAEAYATALKLLRTISPHALDADDPTPERTELFRVHADEVTGRECSPSS